MFLLKDKGEVKDFLGIQVSCNLQNSTITLTHPGLIDSVLQDIGLLSPESSSVKNTHQLHPFFIPILMAYLHKKHVINIPSSLI